MSEHLLSLPKSFRPYEFTILLGEGGPCGFPLPLPLGSFDLRPTLNGKRKKNCSRHTVETLGPKILSISNSRLRCGTCDLIKLWRTQYFQWPRKIMTTVQNFLHAFRIAYVQPILAWGDQCEVIANLQMSPVLVVEDPSTDPESCEVGLT